MKRIWKCYTHPFYQLYMHFMKTGRSSTKKTGHPHTTTETCGLSWIGQRGTFEFPPHSPDLTCLDFYFWGTLKDVMYHRKPAMLGDLHAEIRAASAAIPINTLTEVAQSTARPCNRCLAANVLTYSFLWLKRVYIYFWQTLYIKSTVVITVHLLISFLNRSKILRRHFGRQQIHPQDHKMITCISPASERTL